MRIIKEPNDECKYPLAKCEHCGRMDEAPLDKRIEDVVCHKCGRTQENEKPIPIYPIPDEGNLYKLSYKYLEATSENSPWKPTVEQLQQLIYKHRSVKIHPDNEDSLELSVFLWALKQYESGEL